MILNHPRTFAAGLAAMAMCCTASATFHLMQIEQVIGGVNGDTSAQAIQLRMRAPGQNLVAQGKVVVRDATGSNAITVIDMTTNVPNGATGSRVLISSANFANYTNPPAVPNFTMTNLIPDSYLAAGTLTFENNAGTLVYWRLSWGGANYTGPCNGTMDNDANGNFCPPFPGVLPSDSLQALQFTGSATAMSTSNDLQYAVTAGPAVFTNNAGTAYTVVAPDVVGACCFAPNECTERLSADECIKAGGEFLGDASTCETCVAEPTGACCFTTGNCTPNLTEADCLDAAGEYLGDASTCDTCVAATGACCFDGSECTADVTETDCINEGGEFLGVKSSCDFCEPHCDQDISGDDHVVGAGDLGALLATWGPCVDCPADFNDDEVVDAADLGTLLANWGPCK
jgi:hypothetical protein